MSKGQTFQNKLLASLSSVEYERIFTDLQLIKVYASEVLYDSGEIPHSVFFPINCLITLQYETGTNSNKEMITVGNESAVGVSMLLSNQAMPYSTIVQASGQVYRLPKASFVDEFNRRGSLYQKVLGYTLILPIQKASGEIFSHDYKIDSQSRGS